MYGGSKQFFGRSWRRLRWWCASPPAPSRRPRCRKASRISRRTARARACRPFRAALGPAPRRGRAACPDRESRRPDPPAATPSRSRTRPPRPTPLSVDGKLAFAPSVNTQAVRHEPAGHGGRDGDGHAWRPRSRHGRRPDRRRHDRRNHHREQPARRQCRRPRPVRHRHHRAGQGVDARQPEDADLRAPRHRAARGAIRR